MSDEKRLHVATTLIDVVQAAFPDAAVLVDVVRLWVGFTTTAPACAMCTRSLSDSLCVAQGGVRLRLLRGKNAGPLVVCGACLDAARDVWGRSTASVESWRPPEGAPAWDMVRAQLDRAIGLLQEEDAAIARECLAHRPHTPVAGTCLLCKKADVLTIRGRTGGICEPCGHDGCFARQSVRDDIDSRCPECGSREIAAAPVHIEFTEMSCLSCGNSELCDVWQLDDWHA